MSGETIVVYGTTVTLEANGGAIANNTQVQADDSAYDIAANGYYPNADFVLTGTFGTAPTEGTSLFLYARPLDVDGTADTEVPETTRPTRVIGAFNSVNNVTTAQTMIIEDAQVPPNASYYVYNNGTGQSLSAGWTLKVKPRTLKAAP